MFTNISIKVSGVFSQYNIIKYLLSCEKPGPIARSDACPPGMWMVTASILVSSNILSLRAVMKSFLQPFSPYCLFK